MTDIIVKIFIAVIVVGGVAWSIWFENAPDSKKKDAEDKDEKRGDTL